MVFGTEVDTQRVIDGRGEVVRMYGIDLRLVLSTGGQLGRSHDVWIGRPADSRPICKKYQFRAIAFVPSPR